MPGKPDPVRESTRELSAHTTCFDEETQHDIGSSNEEQSEQFINRPMRIERLQSQPTVVI